MSRLFGTDGVRGLANRDVTAELALDLSVAAAHVLGSLGQFEGHRPRAIVGRAQDVRGRDREVERELGGDVPVGEPTHAVGTEQSAHGQTPSS